MEKTDYLRHYRIHLIVKILVTIFCAGAGFVLVFFLIDVLFNGLIGNSLSHSISYTFAAFVLDNKYLFLFLGVVGTMVVTWYISQLKLSRDLSQVMESIDLVFRKDDTLIQLPKEMKAIETKLNTLKFNNIRNEQLAREAEQRKDDLVVYLAHDLKTPLTSVIGYLSLLNDETAISPELRARYLQISLDKALRLEDLINEFFDITRFSLQGIVLEKEEINLNLFLEQMADEFYPTLAEKGLSCHISAEEDLRLTGDADKLARVFDNLLRNAIAYSYPQSPITIFARRVNEGVQISFVNRGKVIPQQNLSAVFDKFFRLDTARQSRTGGAGLGLAIAKEIVELHGGRIYARSSETQTDFNVILPAEGQHT